MKQQSGALPFINMVETTTTKKLLACKPAIKIKWYQFKLLYSLFKHYLALHPVPPSPSTKQIPPAANRQPLCSQFWFYWTPQQGKVWSQHQGWPSQNSLIPRSLQKITSPIFPYEEKYLPFPQSPPRPTEENRIPWAIHRHGSREQACSKGSAFHCPRVPLWKSLWMRFFKTSGVMVPSTCERFLEMTTLKSLLSLKNPNRSAI